MNGFCDFTNRKQWKSDLLISRSSVEEDSENFHFLQLQHLLFRSKHHTVTKPKQPLRRKCSGELEPRTKSQLSCRWQIAPTQQPCEWHLSEINLPPDAIRKDGPYQAKPYPNYIFMSKTLFEKTLDIGLVLASIFVSPNTGVASLWCLIAEVRQSRRTE